MRAIVVYESMYGNTRHVAEAIGDGLRGVEGADEVSVMSVHEAGPEVVGTADLLVVGGPTHVHGMSRPSTRRGAVEQLEGDLALDPEAPGDGVREWLEALGPGRARAAAYDTRVDMPSIVTGRAAKGIAKALHHHGYQLVGEPTSFLVTKDTHLEPGELERATAWGADLARALHPEAAPPRS